MMIRESSIARINKIKLPTAKITFEFKPGFIMIHLKSDTKTLKAFQEKLQNHIDVEVMSDGKNTKLKRSFKAIFLLEGEDRKSSFAILQKLTRTKTSASATLKLSGNMSALIMIIELIKSFFDIELTYE